MKKVRILFLITLILCAVDGYLSFAFKNFEIECIIYSIIFFGLFLCIGTEIIGSMKNIAIPSLVASYSAFMLGIDFQHHNNIAVIFEVILLMSSLVSVIFNSSIESKHE